MEFLTKVIVSAFVIAGVAELGKRFTLAAAILASLPLTSILAMIWLFRETKDVEKISTLSTGIFWAVLPSLVFFLILPALLKNGIKFQWAMLLSSGIMFVGYVLYGFLLGRLGIKLE